VSRQGSHPHPEGWDEGSSDWSRIAKRVDRFPPGIPSRRVRVSRLRLVGRRKAGSACPCTDPPRLVRYLRYVTYVLAIAIVTAVAIKDLYGATQPAEEGQVPGLHDSRETEATEPLGRDLRRLLRTRTR
jgi:hypothetical protein